MEIKKIIVDIPLYEMRNLEHYELCANVKETVTPELAEQQFYKPTTQGREGRFKARMEQIKEWHQEHDNQ